MAPLQRIHRDREQRRSEPVPQTRATDDAGRKRRECPPTRVLPFPAEDVCVNCVLPSGSRKWWPTTVESITVREGDDDILADASLLYHTAYGYPAERAEAQFRKDKTVRTRTVSWTHAAWVFTDDDKPVAEELNTRTRCEEEPSCTLRNGRRKDRRTTSSTRTDCHTAEIGDFPAMAVYQTRVTPKEPRHCCRSTACQTRVPR